MSTLDVPGAQLYYEVRGRGPLLLLIPGAPGDARVFPALADQLAQRYTVVTYDRRGFSRSHLDGAQDYAQRLSTDATDVVRLIQHLGEHPATVFGSSSGGVVALQLLIEHPDVVQTVIPYEPAAMHLLPNGQRWLDFNYELYELYRQQGPAPALAKFRERTFPESDRVLMSRPSDPANAGQVLANATYWFERELRQYPAVQLDQAALIRCAGKVVPAVGRASRGYPTYATGIELAKTLSCPVLELPGGHVGYATEPGNFARQLLAALS